LVRMHITLDYARIYCVPLHVFQLMSILLRWQSILVYYLQ
jgi:hypothetical protein